MNSAIATHVGASVARRTGIPVAAVLTAPSLIRLEPSGYGRHEAFVVELRTGWRNAEAAFVPGTFAMPLLRNLAQAGPEGRIAFAALAEIASREARLTFRINGTEASPAADASWPTAWENLELSLRKHGLVPEEMSPVSLAATLADLAVPVCGMIASLSGIDEVEADEAAREGAVSEVVSRRYERRPVNREICIALKGRRCWCCNLDFGLVYGKDADGFIEVHHKVPVSGMGPNYQVHPVRDLFPVCSNCHSVIHFSRPPEDPDALRARLKPAGP